MVYMEDCILWEKSTDRGGYGRTRYKGRETTAHRRVYQEAYGDLPSEIHVMHKCDNPACVNLEHLTVGTAKDNMADKIAKGRDINSNKSHCKRGHEMTPENTYVGQQTGKNGNVYPYRHCRICRREARNLANVKASANNL